MVEIPVKHKDKSAFPLWLLPLAALALLGVALLFLRGRHDDNAVTTDTAARPAVAAASQAPAVAAGPTCASDKDCSGSQLCSSGTCRALVAGSDCSETRVHFATNSAAIPEADRPLVDRMARCLQANQSIKLAIEGNADQRGTDEHNDVLADQRAKAIAHDLEARGVSPAQLRVVSYGDHNLLCGENDADCWAKNRRAAVRPEAR